MAAALLPFLRTLLVALLVLAVIPHASASPVVSRAYVLPAIATSAPQNAAQFAGQAGAIVIPGVSSPSVALLVDASGGDLVALEGSGFGAAQVAGGSCVFVPWTFRVTTLQLRCDGMETFLGEGEISGADVRFWSASLIVVAVPPGLGSKEVSVYALGSSSSAGSVPLAYSAPRIVSISPQYGDTEGDTEVTVSGSGLGPNARDMRIASNRIASFPVPLSIAPQLPTAFLVVLFDFACIALAYDATGYPSNLFIAGLGWPLSRCFTAPIVINGNGTEATFRLPPGVGAKHSVSLLVTDSSVFTTSSNSVSFSYNPPVATNFSPAIVALSRLGTSDIRVFGSGFGSRDLSPGGNPGWTQNMTRISASFGGVFFVVSRVRYPAVAGIPSHTALSCSLNPAMMPPGGQLPAGWQRFVVDIGGQTQTVENAMCFDNAEATACSAPPPTASLSPSPSAMSAPSTSALSAPWSSQSSLPSPSSQSPSPSGLTAIAITGVAVGAAAAALLCAAGSVAAHRKCGVARARSIASSKIGEVVIEDVFVVSPAAAARM